MKQAALTLSLLCCAGCDDPLLDPQRVDGPRVIAGRVTRDGAPHPKASELLPGEKGRLEFLVASDAAQKQNALVRLCQAELTTLGVPRCQAPPFLERTMVFETNQAGTIELQLPELLSSEDEWLAQYGSCTEGAVSYDETDERFTCEDGEVPLEAFLRTQVLTTPPNQHPSFEAAKLSLNGEVWNAVAPGQDLPVPGEDCSGSELSSFVTGSNEIRLVLGAEQREQLDNEDRVYATVPRESLVFTQLMTAPGLERAFSAISYDEALRDLAIEFTPDLEVTPSGTVVLFYLVMRDERGGLDWLVRAACSP